jgi:tetratricopeptide (TPR) repeat protein
MKKFRLLSGLSQVLQLAALAASAVLTISLPSPAAAQQELDVVQCFCNGQYRVMPRGTDCRALCVGSGRSTGAPVYTPPPVQQPSPAELQRRRMNAVNEQGRAALKNGDYQNAVRLFKDALALAAIRGDALIIQHNIGSAYSFLASEAQERGDLDEALAMLRQAMSYYPNESQHDWPGWEKYLRDAIVARQQAAEEAAREAEAQHRQAAEEARQEAENRLRQSQLAQAEQNLQLARQQLETERLARAEQDLQSARRALQDLPPVGAGPRTSGPVAAVKVPSPLLDSRAWSRSFPSEKPAAFQLSKPGLEQLPELKQRSAAWLGDRLKEAGKEKLVETLMEHLPFSEAINREIDRQHGLIDRYKELYEEKAKSGTEYVTGFFEIAHDWVACQGAGGGHCEATASANLETITNKYANEEGERWKPWLREDIKSHGEIE